jgi:cyclase
MSSSRPWKIHYAALTAFLLACTVTAPCATQQIGKDLYAYISDNDASANSTFLIGDREILVVDTGLNATEGAKLLDAIRQISNSPVKFIVNTHYHPDHQGGNVVFGKDAVVISTGYTRARTLELMKNSATKDFHFRPADLTFQDKIEVHVGRYPVEIYFPGPAHTLGDSFVYFPEQHAIATGDLFLNGSCPAMDKGSVANWIKALTQVLDLPFERAVPGHFDVGTKSDVRRFRDYLSDLYTQVSALKKKGATLDQVRSHMHLEKYSDFHQYPKYEASFSDNAATVYGQLH